MPLSPPLCLEAVFIDVQDYATNEWQCTLTINAQGYGAGQYDGSTVTVGMWTSNANFGFVYRIKSISVQTPSSIVCVVEDVSGYNAIIDPSQGTSGVGPNINFTGYIYELNANELPVLNLVGNPISLTWTDAQLARFLYFQRQYAYTGATGGASGTGGTGPTGETGPTGPKGADGTAAVTGATGEPGPTGATGPTGLPGSATNTGATGEVGPTGEAGPTGVTGPAVNAVDYQLYSNSSLTPPGTTFSINSSNLASVTILKLADTDLKGINRDAFFSVLGYGTQIHLLNRSTLDEHVYTLETITDHGTYWTFTVSNVYGASSTPTIGTYFEIFFDSVGQTGATGPTGFSSTGETGPTGPAGYSGSDGPTGPTGEAIYVATVFDGGSAFSTYPLGPAFDCGTST